MKINRELEVTRIALQIIRDFEKLYDWCNTPESITDYGVPTGYSLRLGEIACERLSNVQRMKLPTIDRYVLDALYEALQYAKRTETIDWLKEEIEKAELNR